MKYSGEREKKSDKQNSSANINSGVSSHNLKSQGYSTENEQALAEYNKITAAINQYAKADNLSIHSGNYSSRLKDIFESSEKAMSDLRNKLTQI